MWVNRAACRQLPRSQRSTLFFPQPFSPEEDEWAPVAKRVCNGCPVRVECLAWTIADEDARSAGEPTVFRWGIAGGLLARERDALPDVTRGP